MCVQGKCALINVKHLNSKREIILFRDAKNTIVTIDSYCLLIVAALTMRKMRMKQLTNPVDDVS